MSDFFYAFEFSLILVLYFSFIVLFSFCLPFDVVVQNQGKFMFILLGLLWNYDKSRLDFLAIY